MKQLFSFANHFPQHSWQRQVNMATAPAGCRPCSSWNECNGRDPGPTSSATTPLGAWGAWGANSGKTMENPRRKPPNLWVYDGFMMVYDGL